MAKDRSFQTKVAKAQSGPINACPVCKEARVTYYVVRSEKNSKTNGWRFRDVHLQVCKCNEKELLS